MTRPTSKPHIRANGVFRGSAYNGCRLWCCDSEEAHSAGVTPHEAWWYWQDSFTNETGEQEYPFALPSVAELLAATP